MNFFNLPKTVVLLYLFCSAVENEFTEAVGYFECTDKSKIPTYESTNKITTEFESTNEFGTSVPMQTTTEAFNTILVTSRQSNDSVEGSTNTETPEMERSPFFEASTTVSEKSTETGTVCPQTSSQLVELTTDVIRDLPTEFEGLTETEGWPSTSKQQLTEVESKEPTTSRSRLHSTETLTSRPTTDFKSTVKAKDTTSKKTTESETTIRTIRETTTSAKCCADCYQLYGAGYIQDGIYEITPSQWPGLPFEVFCKNGWTVIQRRVDGSVDFERTWDAYKEGFGFPDNELWLGNEKLFYVTNQTKYELRIDLIMSDDTAKYLNYDLFRVGDEVNNYRLSLGDYTGNAGKDFMGYHNNQFFTTFDRDNDNAQNENCALSHDAGWWFNFCYAANLNGDYFDTGNDGICVVDRSNFQYQCGIQYCEMKIRPLP